MRAALIILTFLGLFAAPAWAQREGEHWYFGSKCGMNFRLGEPVALTDGAMTTREGCVTMSDSTGKLLFYSDGSDVWNRNHQVMSNGFGLFGNSSSTQSSIVINWPGDDSRFILFTVDAVENRNVKGLNYTVVDMDFDNGLGSVTVKNEPLVAPASEKITAVRHANGEDIWVIGHSYDTNEFLIFRVTAAGVDPVPIRQAIGPVVLPTDIGHLKASTEGTRIAMATFYPPMLTIYTFDKQTGVLANSTVLSESARYGVEFSKSGRFLYSATPMLDTVDQYDLDLPWTAVSASRFMAGLAWSPGALQLAPNGKIYIAQEGSTMLSVIHKPDLPREQCTYQRDGFSLGRTSRLGLPNFFPAILTAEPTYWIVGDTGCVGDTFHFRLEDMATVRNVTWNFGDPGSGTNNRRNGNPVWHIFSQPGKFTVRATFFNDVGAELTRTIDVDVFPLPDVDAGPDRTICAGSPVQLNATGAVSYEWSPPELYSNPTIPNPTVRPTQRTTYYVKGMNEFGCVNYDSVTITPTGTAITASPDTTICEGGVAFLRVEGADRYVWSPANGLDDPNSATPQARPSRTATYRVIGTKGSCTDTAWVTVTLEKPPTLVTSGDVTACPGSATVLWAQGAVRYQWEPASEIADPTNDTVIVRPTQRTTYTVRGWSAAGCEASTTVTVTIGNAESVRLSGDTLICFGATATLTCLNTGTVSWTDRVDGTTYQGNTINVQPTTSRWYIADLVQTGCTGRDSIYVVVKDNPTVQLSGDTLICQGQPATLTCTTTGTVLWTDRTTGATYTTATITTRPLTDTWFVAEIDEGGCAGRDSIFVNVLVAPTLTVTSDTAVCAGSAVTLTATSDGQILWDAHPDISDRTASVITVTPNGTTTYTVRASNAVCETSAQVTVSTAPFETVEVISQQIDVVPDLPIIITVSATDDASALLPITSVIRLPSQAGEVNVLAAAGVTEVGRVNNGTEQEITILVDALPQQPALFELQVRPLLTARSNVMEIITTPTGCVVPDTASIILTPDQCAGSLRAVQIGADASFTLGIAPNPATDVVTVSWSSAAIGEHLLQIVSVVGEVVAEHRFSRMVTSPTAGSVMLDLSGYTSGGYSVVMLRPGDALTAQMSKAE